MGICIFKVKWKCKNNDDIDVLKDFDLCVRMEEVKVWLDIRLFMIVFVEKKMISDMIKKFRKKINKCVVDFIVVV